MERICINIKSFRSTISVIFVIIFLLVSFVPKSFWNKLFNFRQTATVFTSATSGDWNNRITWGATSPYGIFETPQATFVDDLNNKLYVLDSGNNRVVVMDPLDGTVLDTYDSLGLSYPQGMTVSTTTGYIYIADTNNNQIVVLDSGGSLYDTYDNLDAGYATTGLSYPTGITLSPSEEIYIADNGNNRIVVLNADGTASTTLYETGLLGPKNLIISSSSKLYVADTDNNIISSGLISEYRFDNARSNDSSGNSYNSSFNNATWLSTGGHDGRGGYSFNGSGQNIHTTMPYTVINDDSWTVSVWAYGNNPTASWSWIIGETSGSGNPVLIGKQSGVPLMHIFIGGCGTFHNVPADIFDSVYHHVVLIDDGGSLSLYVDNVFVTNLMGSGCTPNNTSNMRIGSRNFGSEYWSGAIDDLRVYDRALTLDEIGELYNEAPVNNRVVVLNPDTTVFDTYDNLDAGYATTGLSYPTGITLSPSEEIYIADNGNNRIVVLNSDGTASTTLYETGLLGPKNLIISSSSKLYVADTDHNKVTILNADGTEYQIEGLDYPGIGDNVIINTGTITLTQDQSVNDLTLASGGTLDLNGYTLNVNGNWSNTGGTLINNGGTINLVGTTTQIITGTNTFYNLTKIASTTSELLFDPLNTITVTGTLNLSGTPGNILTIAPNTGSLLPTFIDKIESDAVSGFSSLYRIAFSSTNNKTYTIDHDGPYGRIIVINPDGATATTTFGSALATSFHSIRSIDASPSGNIYLTDGNTDLIYVLNSDGTVASTTYASGVGLSSEQDTTISSSTGAILIADSNNYRVVALNSDGTVASTTYGSDLIDAWVYPYLITTSPVTDKIYVAEHFGPSGRIVVLNSDGSVASSSFASGLFSHNIVSMDVSPLGIVYFNNSSANTIYGVNEDGSIATTTFGSSASLLYPNGLSISSTGEMYVSDSNNDRVVVLDINGIASTTYTNQIPGTFSNPYGIVHDSANNIYVSDTDTNNIQKFDSSGNFISFLNTSGSGGLNDPFFLASDSSDNIYAIDYGDTPSNIGRIVKFNSSGNYSTSSPSMYLDGGIAVDSSDNLYVSTYVPQAILKLDSNFSTIISTTTYNGNTFSLCSGGISLDQTETFIFVMDRCNNKLVKLNTSDLSYVSSSTGPSEASFGNPYSLSSDTSGNLYVSDTNNYRIIKLSPSFSYITQWGTFGNGDYQFSYPAQLTTDLNNHLYVVDVNNQNVKKYDLTINFTPFNINYTGSGTTDFSYLSVSGSTNQSPNPFNCLTGCVNVGGNTNWIFVTPATTGGIEIVPIWAKTKLPTTPVLPETPIYVEPIVNTPTATTTEPILSFCFDKNLESYTSDIDVKNLQIFLNEKGFNSLPTGLENNFYGPETNSAVTSFQNYYASEILNPLGLKSGTGIFGNYTRKKVNDILGCPTIFEKVIEEPKATTTPEKIIEETLPPKEEITEVVPEETTFESKEVNPSEPKTPEIGTISLNLVAGFLNSITQSYDQVLVLVQDTIARLGKILRDTTLSQAAKIVATASLVLGVTSAIGAIAFANPISFSEIWMIPSRLMGLVLGALGIRKKNRSWGTVYDSQTKRPLDPVYVTLIDTITNKEVASAITDIDGRYSFLTLPGIYKIIAQKTNYIFPSERMHGKIFDEVYNDIYTGGEVSITVPGEIITKNIPMDSQNFDWNEFAKTNMNVNTFTKAKDITWAKISKTIFIIGFIISSIALFFAPEPYNFIITGVYILAYLFNYAVFKPQTSGTLINNMTKLPLSFAVVRVFREGETEPMLKKISDKDGKYFILLPKGKYFIEIDKKNLDGSYIKVYKSELMQFDEGIINQSLSV